MDRPEHEETHIFALQMIGIILSWNLEVQQPFFEEIEDQFEFFQLLIKKQLDEKKFEILKATFWIIRNLDIDFLEQNKYFIDKDMIIKLMNIGFIMNDKLVNKFIFIII